MHEQLQQPEQHEAEPRDGPRIYVASLSDYNAGILHGTWLDATDDESAMESQISTMLERSPTAAREGLPAEEWAIHDYEGFGPLRLGEYDSLGTIARLASGIAEHGPAFSAWAAYVGLDSDELDQFEDHYLGEWDSLESYAESLLDDLGAPALLDQLPAWLQPYVALDIAAFARDLELGGDIAMMQTDTHTVFLFSGR